MSYTPVPAGGIEPPHDGATTRCLPTWLSRRMMVAEAGIEPAPDEAYETPALPTELFRACCNMVAPLGFEPSRPSSKPGALPARRRGNTVEPRAGFEPAPSDLKDRRPRPLDERGEVERAARIELACLCLVGSGSAVELRPHHAQGWHVPLEACLRHGCAQTEMADGAGIEPARPKRSRRISIALPYRSANHPMGSRQSVTNSDCLLPTAYCRLPKFGQRGWI